MRVLTRSHLFALVAILLQLGCQPAFQAVEQKDRGSVLSRQSSRDEVGAAESSAGVAATPYMGFSTYYSSRIQKFQMNQLNVAQIARDLKNYGLADAGYTLLQMDIGWWYAWTGSPRDPVSREIIPAPLFPDLPGLIREIHDEGLQVGLYTDTGAGDAEGCGGFPGSGEQIQQDVLQMAGWGVDFLKVDHCGGNPRARAEGIHTVYQGSDYEYGIWRQAIQAATAKTGRPIIFNIADWNFVDRTPGWAPAISNSWRTQSDIDYRAYDLVGDTYVYNPSKSSPISWNLIFRNFLANDVPPAAGPGHWNDPDHLLIGGFGLTPIEEQSYYNMWTIQAAPLILATYPADLAPSAPDGARLRALLMNPESIAVHQDPLGRQGEKVREDAPGLRVYSKALSGRGRRAVLLVNATPIAAPMSVHLGDLGLAVGIVTRVRDLVDRRDLNPITEALPAMEIPAHGSRLLLISGSESTSISLAEESPSRKFLGAPSVLVRGGREMQAVLGLDRDFWFRSGAAGRTFASGAEWRRVRPVGCTGDVQFFGEPSLTYANGAVHIVGLGYVDRWGADQNSVTTIHSYSYDEGASWVCYGDLGIPTGGLYGRLGFTAHGTSVDVLGRGQDNSLYRKTWSVNTGWSSWTREGGCLRSGVSASARSDGSVDLAVIGCDDRVWHGWYAPGSAVSWDLVPLTGLYRQAPASHWDVARQQYRIYATTQSANEIKSIFWPREEGDYRWGAEMALGGCFKSGVAATGADPVVLVGLGCNTPGTNADTDQVGDTFVRMTD